MTSNKPRLFRIRMTYSTFGKLKPGDRFRFNVPAGSGSGPFVKFDRDSYEDAAHGDDVVQAWGNWPVRRSPPVGIEPN